MRSFIAVALCLSLTHSCSARIPHSHRQLAERDAEPESSNFVMALFKRLFTVDLIPRQDAPSNSTQGSSTNGTCYQDEYYNFVYNSSFGEDLCQMLINYPNQTTTVDYTPIRYVSSLTPCRSICRLTLHSTYTYVTTNTETDYAVVRTTPISTVTATQSTTVVGKHDAQITPMARDISRAERVHDMIQIFRRQMDDANSTAPSDNQMSSSFSSACQCQTYAGSTITETYTNEVDVRLATS